MSNFNSALHATWPLLALMRVLGWFCVERRHDSGTLYLRMRSRLYSGVALSVQVIPLIYVLDRAFKAISRMDPEMHIRAYLLLFLAIISLQTIPILATIQSLPHAKFWNSTWSLQTMILRKSKEPLQFGGLRTMVNVTIVAAALPFLCILIILPYYLTISWKICIYFSLSLFNISILSGWWMAVTTIICIFSQRILEDFKQRLCNQVESKKSDAKMGRLALTKRMHWLHVCQLLSYAGEAMSLALTNILLNILATLVYCVYQLISGQNLYASIYFSTIIFIGTSNVYVICSWAQYASTKVKADMLLAMELAKELSSSKDIQRMIITFLTLANDKNLHISLGGYIYLQKSLISSIAYAVITNMLVLYQLRIDEHKFDIQEIFNFGNADI